jgi:hypothetical protein
MQCTVCDTLKNKATQARTEVERASCLKQLDEHRLQFAADRVRYAHHKKKAQARPDKYMSIAIDSMDSSKSRLPSPRRDNHATAKLGRLTFGLVGVLCHGRRSFNRCYTYPMDVPHDCNVTIQALMDTLRDAAGEDGSLPDVLYLQLDNTVRENKNRYMIAFCSFLVNIGWFKKVCLCSLDFCFYIML